MAIGIPLGIVVAKNRYLGRMILGVGGVLQTIPSLAALAILVPIFGIGVPPTLVVLVAYALFPILKNTAAGLEEVPKESLEASFALGHASFVRLFMVELPLALPMILVGIRIAIAMIIGLTTIAAFIGAGGLGDFITQGISLSNIGLVLLGAIPAAGLALFADFTISVMAIRHNWRNRSTKRSLGQRIALPFCLLTLVTLIMASHFVKRSFGSRNNTIVVASKNFTEQYILAEIIAQLLETKTKLMVKRELGLGTTDVLLQALIRNDVDIYPEYTGTAYLTVLHESDVYDSAKIRKLVRDYYLAHFNLVWLAPLGFTNSQTLAVRKTLAEKYHLETLSDLKSLASQLVIAAPPEFVTRPDAFLGLKKTYGITFKEIRQIDPNLMYTAISHGKVDIIVAFATDGKLSSLNLVALVDDRRFSFSYDAEIVIRDEILQAHPEVAQALKLLTGLIDQETMTRLNSEVDLNNHTPKEVAHRFLIDRGLL